MPTNEYECVRCEGTFEAFQGISEPPLTACPGPLRGQDVHPRGSGLHFRGSGFYATDYRIPAYVRDRERGRKTGASSEAAAAATVRSTAAAEKGNRPAGVGQKE